MKFEYDWLRFAMWTMATGYMFFRLGRRYQHNLITKHLPEALLSKLRLDMKPTKETVH